MNRYEDLLKRSPKLYAPISKIEDVNGSVEACVSYYVLGPCLVSFVLWLLQTAIKDGKERLYFLARDGYFMYNIAKKVCAKNNLSIECRYLCCSRYALRTPQFHTNLDEALDYICRTSIGVNIYTVLLRAGLTKGEQKDIVGLLPEDVKEGTLSNLQLERIKKILSGCKPFVEYMNFNSEKSLSGLQGYLSQEGLLDDMDDAIVDSGWVGSTQKDINKILNSMGREKPVEGYYWGLYELPPGVDSKSYHTYYFSPKNGIKRKVYFNNCLFESIMSAPFGVTIGYAEKGGYFEPSFDISDEENNNLMNRIGGYLDTYTDVLLDEAGDVLKIDMVSNKKTVYELLKEFMCYPSIEEAQVFGVQHFSDDVLERDSTEIAKVLNEEEMKQYHFFPKLTGKLFNKNKNDCSSAWYEGSVVRGGTKVFYHLFQYTLFKRFLYTYKTLLNRSTNA